MELAKIYINIGKLNNTNINRSPSSYLLNPYEERMSYQTDGDTDKNMLLLKFVSLKNPKRIIGILNWYAVHGTSMNNTNTLVSGDNKGYASYAFEHDINEHNHNTDTDPLFPNNNKPFVAGFASTNLGDVSPNINGPKCRDTGLSCEGNSSSCNHRCENCIASGPGRNMVESTKMIGRRQYLFAKQLVLHATEEIQGNQEIDYRHSFVHMPSLELNQKHANRENNIKDTSSSTTRTESDTQTEYLNNNKWKPKKTLCNAAFGYSFAGVYKVYSNS